MLRFDRARRLLPANTAGGGHASRDAATIGRIASLDALRGIAALVVVLFHLSLVVPGVYWRLFAIRPLRIAIAGDTAVLVFFVLSGFVLYLSWLRHGDQGYPAFAAKRVVRLCLPVAAAVLLSAALYLAVAPGPLPGLDGWLTRYSWTEPVTPGLVAGHMLLLDGDRFHSLDNPIWSLAVEVRLSLVFPLLAAGVRRRPWLTLAGCVALSVAARRAMAGHEVAAVDAVLTLRFLDLFAIGAVMARYAGVVTGMLRLVPAAPVIVAMLAMLCVRGRLYLEAAYCGSALLVATGLSYPGLARLYAARATVWLGDRSFSLYLVHVPLLLASVHLLAGRLPIGVVLALTLPLCLAGAELFWRAVERPSITLSHRVARRLSRSRAAA